MELFADKLRQYIDAKREQDPSFSARAMARYAQCNENAITRALKTSGPSIRIPAPSIVQKWAEFLGLNSEDTAEFLDLARRDKAANSKKSRDEINELAETKARLEEANANLQEGFRLALDIVAIFEREAAKGRFKLSKEAQDILNILRTKYPG
jgi:hypothetical protein